MSEGQINLPLIAGSRGSDYAAMVTMDERMCELQSAQRHMGTTRLPNPVTTCMSRKRTNLCINKSQIQFESDTFIYNNILLDLAKYIH